MTLNLRHKFLIGFGGLLAITILVTTIGSSVIDAYSNALQKVLRENYDSIVYGEAMKQAEREIENHLSSVLWENRSIARETIMVSVAAFDSNLHMEQGNITLPREGKTVERLGALWNQYRQACDVVLDTLHPMTERRELFRSLLAPLGDSIHVEAQRICEMNLANMSSIDGQASRKANEAELVIYFLVIAGAILALVLIIITGRAILQPLHALTESVREIQKGNLNLVLQPRSRDEVGQLTEAFNEMAAQLREYRRGERAKLIRTAHSTQSVIDSLPDAVAIMNTFGIVELSNKSAQELFGLYPEINITTRKDDLLREMFFSTLLMEQPDDHLGIGSAMQVFKDGDERFFLPHAIPVMGETRAIIGVTIVLADVTRLRRVTELEVGPISVVSHELKTPLTSVRMAIHMLFDERIGFLNPKQTELLSAARNDSERLYQIMENLLDISRMEAGHGNLDLHPASPEKLVRDAINEFQVAYRSAGVELTSDLPDDLPDVLADPLQLPHVFSNLLTNALKFSPAGSVVKISARSEAMHLVFSVQDQGPGISEHDLSRVFQRFYRAGNQRMQGAGLGLAIAKEIVEAHGGMIGVKSYPGEGSTFEFTLKRADAKEV